MNQISSKNILLNLHQALNKNMTWKKQSFIGDLYKIFIEKCRKICKKTCAGVYF